MERCSGIAAAFSGNDIDGYEYIIGSKTVDLRVAAKDINAAIHGKGGGSREMIQGTAKASEAVIRSAFDCYVEK